MTTIPLENGGQAKVSEADFARLSEYLWWKCEDCGHIIRVVDAPEGVVTRYMAADVLGVDMPVWGSCKPCPLPKKSQKTGSMNSIRNNR